MSKQNKKKEIKSANSDQNNGDSKKEEKKETSDNNKAPKYGPMPTFPRQRVFTRAVIVISTVLVVYFTSKDDRVTTFAAQKDSLPQRNQDIECSPSYQAELKTYPNCVPEKCGRVVTDKLITAQETDVLLTMAKNGFALGSSNGGASILDLHSGALSHNDKFINIYSLPKAQKVFTASDFAIYKIVKSKIQHAISHNFGVDVNQIYLTHPTFFSKLTNAEARTPHDEYWHIHVDKETYPSFHYTSLLYLTDYGVDFEGGRFVFTAPGNATVEPRRGRVSMFTSGAENPHYVEKVKSGIRYAITVSFTCDPNRAIQDPNVLKVDK